MDEVSSYPNTSQMKVSHFWHAIERGQYHRCILLLKCDKRKNRPSQLLTLNEQSTLKLLFQSFKKFKDSSEFIKIALALIEVAADVQQISNLEDENNLRLLQYTCNSTFFKSEILESFLKHGADVNAQTLLKNKPHYTPLHYAVQTNNFVVIRLLLEYGADPNIPDIFGQTALMHASLTKDDEIFSILIDYDADVNFHVEKGPIALEHAICSNNLNKFSTLWILTDIKFINKRLEDILDTMITCMWYKPNKIKYLYQVLDTPGIILPSNYRFLHKLAVELTKMDEDFEDIIVEEELTKQEFLEIDVYGIVKKLLEKDISILAEDLEGLVYLCHRYHNFNLPERELELVNLLVNNNVKITSYVIFFAVVNYPKFCTTLLQFCTQCGPIDVFKHIIVCDRLDEEILNLIKELLNVCNPPGYLKLKCAAQIKLLFESEATWIRENMYISSKTITPFHKMIEGNDVDTQLYKEVYNTLVIYNKDIIRIRYICNKIRNIISANNILYNLVWVPLFKLYGFCKKILNKK